MKRPSLTRPYTQKQIQQGDCIPTGWGVAWYRPETRHHIIMPIPFNWVAGWLRIGYNFIVKGPVTPRDEQMAALLHAEFRVGYERGYQDGLKESMKVATELVGSIFATSKPDVR